MSKRRIIEKIGEDGYLQLKRECNDFLRLAFGPNYKRNKLCRFVKASTRGMSYLGRMRTTILILAMFKEHNITWENVQDAFQIAEH